MKPNARLMQVLRSTPWAMHTASYAVLAALARGGAVAEADVEQLRPQAARGSETVSTGGVAVLSLRGMITPQESFLSMIFGGGGGGLQRFRAQLHEAVATEDITGIVIDFDTPGGSTDLVAETAADIRRARTVKPVVAVANTWAASAGYWLFSQADEAVITPSGEAGSIGVFVAHEEYSKMDEQIGITTTLISAGKYKTEGNPFEPLSDEAKAALQAKVDAYYDLFVADVAAGRKVAEASVRSGFGEGRMLTAGDAVAAGMADRVDTLESTIATLVRNPQPPRASRALATQVAAEIARRQQADAQALLDKTSPKQSEGAPEPNAAVPAAEEATARPSESYIDLMYGAPR